MADANPRECLRPNGNEPAGNRKTIDQVAIGTSTVLRVRLSARDEVPVLKRILVEKGLPAVGKRKRTSRMPVTVDRPNAAVSARLVRDKAPLQPRVAHVFRGVLRIVG